MPHPNSGTVPVLPCPKSAKTSDGIKYAKTTLLMETDVGACMVISLSSTITSFVRKSAPMVALYLWEGGCCQGHLIKRMKHVGTHWQAAHWLLNFLLTYWFMREVFPTPESPRMITLRRVFFRVAISSGSPLNESIVRRPALCLRPALCEWGN